jgi:hypothetical protein
MSFVGTNALARKVSRVVASLVLPLMWMGHWSTLERQSVAGNLPKRSSIEMGKLA